MRISSLSALIRSLIGVANEIADSGYDPQGRTSRRPARPTAESKVFAIAEGRAEVKTKAPQNVDSILEKTLERIRNPVQRLRKTVWQVSIPALMTSTRRPLVYKVLI